MNFRCSHSQKQNSSNEVTLSRIKSNINYLVIQIDQVFLTQKSPLISQLLSNGEILGFTLIYKFPNATEVVASALKFSDGDVLFKYKKVFNLELSKEVIQRWDSSSLQILFSMKEHSFMQPLCKGNIHLSELLAPPFMINRYIDLSGVDVTASLSISIKLGSRQHHTAEMLSKLRRSVLNTTFTVSRRREGGSRTRSRSVSRCRSCSTGENIPRFDSPTPTPLVHMSPRKTTLNRLPLQPVVPRTAPRSSCTGSVSERRGAVNLRLTLHRAKNLPLVRDLCGNYVSPRAGASILARDATVMSTIAHPNRNPRWEWSGDFVFSLERGNLLVKLFHKADRDSLEPLGIVTIDAPLGSFDHRKFKVLNAAPDHALNNATVIVSLVVSRRPPSVAGSHGSYDKISISRSLAGSSNSIRSVDDHNGLLRWTGTAASPHLELRTRRPRSISRSSTVETPVMRRPDTSNQLDGHLRDLDNMISRLH